MTTKAIRKQTERCTCGHLATSHWRPNEACGWKPCACTGFQDEPSERCGCSKHEEIAPGRWYGWLLLREGGYWAACPAEQEKRHA